MTESDMNVVNEMANEITEHARAHALIRARYRSWLRGDDPPKPQSDDD